MTDERTPNPQTGSQGQPPWLDQVIIVAADLDKLGMALSAFIKSDPQYRTLHAYDRYLLRYQLNTMTQYFGVLQERIRRGQGGIVPLGFVDDETPQPVENKDANH